MEVTISVVRTSLADGLRQRLAGTVDLILFNPPYVPTEETETAAAQSDRGIAGSWAGGTNGMDVTNRLLAQAGVSQRRGLQKC